jgi:hypothetical protein
VAGLPALCDWFTRPGRTAVSAGKPIDWFDVAELEILPMDAPLSIGLSHRKNIIRSEGSVRDWFRRESIARRGEATGDTAIKRAGRRIPLYGRLGRVGNASQRGYCIHWTGCADNDLAVGLLIGLSVGCSDAGVLIVRWLQRQGQDLHFGTELLADEAQTVRWANGSQDGQGLLLQLQGASRTARQLIAEPGIVVPGAILRIESEAGRWRFRVSRLLEIDPTHERFALDCST